MPTQGYLNDFSYKSIRLGKNIDFFDLGELGLEIVFHKMEWVPFLSLCTLVYTTLV